MKQKLNRCCFFYWCASMLQSLTVLSKHNWSCQFEQRSHKWVLIVAWAQQRNCKTQYSRTGSISERPHQLRGPCITKTFIGSCLTHSSFTTTLTFPLGLYYQRSIRQRGAYRGCLSSCSLFQWTVVGKQGSSFVSVAKSWLSAFIKALNEYTCI